MNLVFPNGGGRLRLDLEIDALRLSTGGLHARWSSSNPFGFVRRALEVAVMKAADAKHEVRGKGDWIADWERGEAVASNFAAAADALLRFLAGGSSALGRLGAEVLVRPLQQMAAHTMTESHLDAKHLWAQQAALTLMDARGIAHQLSPYMRSRRDAIAGSRVNAGEPEKVAFVAVMAEAWVFLMGRLPGSSPVPEKNPFLRLVDAAWQDAGGQADESFVQALRRARKGLSSQALSDAPPSWD